MRTLQVGDWVSHVNRPGEYGQVTWAGKLSAMVRWNNDKGIYWYMLANLLRVIPAPALPKGESDEDK